MYPDSLLLSLSLCLVLFEAAPWDIEGIDEFRSGCHGEDMAVGGLGARRRWRSTQTGTVLWNTGINDVHVHVYSRNATYVYMYINWVSCSSSCTCTVTFLSAIFIYVNYANYKFFKRYILTFISHAFTVLHVHTYFLHICLPPHTHTHSNSVMWFPFAVVQIVTTPPVVRVMWRESPVASLAPPQESTSLTCWGLMPERTGSAYQCWTYMGEQNPWFPKHPTLV